MNTNSALKLVDYVHEHGGAESRIEAHGVTKTLEAMASHEWREDFAKSRAFAFAGYEKAKARLDNEKTSLSRDVFMLVQSFFLEKCPADIDTLPRDQRAVLLKPIWAECNTELIALKRSMLRFCDALKESDFEKGSTWLTYINRISGAVEKGFNPAELYKYSLRFAFLDQWFSYVKRTTDEDKKAQQERAEALADAKEALTPEGKLIAYRAKVLQWFGTILDQCDTIKQLDGLMIGNHLSDKLAETLKTFRSDVSDGEINALKEQFSAMRDSAINPPHDVATVPVAKSVGNNDTKPDQSIADAAFMAYTEGLDVTANPYEKGTDEYAQWKAAYLEAVANAD